MKSFVRKRLGVSGLLSWVRSQYKKIKEKESSSPQFKLVNWWIIIIYPLVLSILQRLSLIFLLNLMMINICSTDSAYKAPKTLPPLMLWTWEAPQDLRSININTTGVALLILNISFKKSQIVYYLRQQPLYVPSNTYLTAVVHIGNPPKNVFMNNEVARFWAIKIKNAYLRGSYKELQIDFDAVTSQQQFYQELLMALRKELGSNTIISITALASWCTNDRWILKANLPINYVVPMFFSLDTNQARRNRFIKAFDSHHLAPYCQGPIGLTTSNDWDVPITTRQPIFIYNTGSWTKYALLKAYALQQQHQSQDK